MATQTRDPTSDVSFTGTWSGSASTRFTLVDDYPSQVDTDILTHGTTTAGEGLFGFTAFSVPAGSINIVVKVNIYAYKNSGAGNSFATRIRAGSTPANADGAGITTLGNGSASIALFTQSFATNPKTGAAWTVADVNGEATNGLNAFGIVGSDVNPSISITSIQLQVEYGPLIIPVAVGDQVTLSETGTPKLLHKPSATDVSTLTDAATAQRWQWEWWGTVHLLDMPQMGDTLTLSDGRTIIIPAEDSCQIDAADQVNIQDAVSIMLLLYKIAIADSLTATDDAVGHVLIFLSAGESLALTEAVTASAGSWEWSGQMHLLVQPQRGDGLTLADVPTVGHDRYAEVAWIELEVPASATEIDVPFGILQSGQIQVQLKYRGSTNRIRAILATNVCGNAGTFIINDNGTEHLVTIPNGTVAEELALDEEVELGSGVDVQVRVNKVSQ